MTVPILYAVEGLTDEPVAERLIEHAGGAPLRRLSGGGKRRIDSRIGGICSAAHTGQRWLVLRDLDRDAPCGGSFVETLGFVVPDWCAYRLAVPSIEAWLLADGDAAADFFGLRAGALPGSPDELSDAKRTLIDLVQRSRKPKVKRDVIPTRSGGRSVGPGYTERIIDFAQNHWRIDVAVGRSPSLKRAATRLEELVAKSS